MIEQLVVSTALSRWSRVCKQGSAVKVAKRINNNAVMCTDSKGRSVVAFGKGIAFVIDRETGDLPLAAIERTFYNVDEHYLALLEELKPEVLAVSADIIEAADLELPYELNHNAVLALADHITFALQRERKGIRIQMPLAYDVAQLYPVECKVGEYAVTQIARKLDVDLPKTEVVGIALCLVNASATPDDEGLTAEQAAEDDAIVSDIARIIERTYDIEVDRSGFEFARFATHMHYLLDRLRTGEPMNTEGAVLYDVVRAQSERAAACLDGACERIGKSFDQPISDSEKLYMLMHIIRISHPRV